MPLEANPGLSILAGSAEVFRDECVRPIAASALTLIPVYLALAIVFVVVLAATLFVVGNGGYAESLLRRATKIRPLRRRVIRSYLRDLEQANPVAARAYSKMEHFSGDAALRHTRQGLSVLSDEERRAYLELFEDQRSGVNREQRRHEVKSERRKASR